MPSGGRSCGFMVTPIKHSLRTRHGLGVRLGELIELGVVLLKVLETIIVTHLVLELLKGLIVSLVMGGLSPVTIYPVIISLELVNIIPPLLSCCLYGTIKGSLVMEETLNLIHATEVACGLVDRLMSATNTKPSCIRVMDGDVDRGHSLHISIHFPTECVLLGSNVIGHLLTNSADIIGSTFITSKVSTASLGHLRVQTGVLTNKGCLEGLKVIKGIVVFIGTGNHITQAVIHVGEVKGGKCILELVGHSLHRVYGALIVVSSLRIVFEHTLEGITGYLCHGESTGELLDTTKHFTNAFIGLITTLLIVIYLLRRLA